MGSNVPIKSRAVKKAWILLDHKSNLCPSITLGTRVTFCDLTKEVGTGVAAVALFHSLSMYPRLLQGGFPPSIDGLLYHCLGCFPSSSLGFQLRSLGFPLRSEGFVLHSHHRSFVADLRPVPLMSCTPAAPFIRRTPRGHQHSTELHPSGTMILRHTIGNPRYETPDLRRAVSTTAVSPSKGVKRERSLLRLGMGSDKKVPLIEMDSSLTQSEASPYISAKAKCRKRRTDVQTAVTDCPIYILHLSI